MTHLHFEAGSMLNVLRNHGESWDHLGDKVINETVHPIGPCSIVDSHGRVELANDGVAKWVGTISVEAPPDSDVHVLDRIQLPNGVVAMVVQPPERPVNQFTGWCPFVKFTLASPGYLPST